MHQNSKAHELSQLPQFIHRKLSQLPESQTERCIYRVHKHLRNVNDKAYDPEIVSIGPYHHGKAELRMMEEHKLRYLQSLLRRKNQSLEQYISVVSELEQCARDFYSEPVSLNSSEFIEMLVLDGCFIVELIRKCSRRHPSCKKDPIFLMDWIMNSLKRDLFLFENQIPFFVLCEVYDMIEAPGQRNRLIYLVLFFCQQSLHPGGVDRDLWEIKHLLDLIHANWQPSLRTVSPDVDDPGQLERELRFIDSATSLTDANVKFSKRTSLTLFDVEFEKGVLSMPTLVVEDRTECFLRNMIVYEQYFPNKGCNFVTDYVNMMDCLINSSKDVDLLSKCGIIDNWLGDSEVVAVIFNKLMDSVSWPDKGFMYSALFKSINKHSERRWNHSMAMLRRKYFSSPWGYITFLSALFLLILTTAQTLVAVVPVTKAWFV